ncbi:Inner membrane protein YohD [Piscirickettsia salmonis]|uniref:DedA family protein n=3 Tax=Piscirickettsia salmonis TaxID=1238 RepID=UPI00204A83B0|nr:Inner membrane protein YohD [Piscirickettsia salmonis]QGP55301.1 Inner membrane protein YohD [Piscirickettsia salmonis]QGP58842.1 Inner membrane protein YohD [Piscirickettsia salmonis]QGP64867.1 Inner membrane protein YohD [Piscirickettsia salmonis]
MLDWICLYITPTLLWLEQHIYAMMFFAAFIEGETFLLLAGIEAAHSFGKYGSFHLPLLIFISVIGSTIHDQLLFALGRFWGGPLLARWPKIEKKAVYVQNLLEKYDIWLILALRYAYGLRTAIPIVLGATKMSWRRFFIFDVIGGVLWSSTFILGGYYFGMALKVLLKHLGHYKGVALIVFVILVILVFVIIWRGRRSKRSEV